MSEQIFNTRIVHKHDTEANWNKAVNFIPKAGELIVYDTDENYNYTRTKVGDGISNINALPFSHQAAVIASTEAPEDTTAVWVDLDDNTFDDKEEIKNYIITELTKREQLTPEFAESKEWLEQKGDITKLYVLPDGFIYAYMYTTTIIESGKNILPTLNPISDLTKTESGLYYGKYTSSSSVGTDNNCTITGIIPVLKIDCPFTFYVKGVSSWGSSSHDRIALIYGNSINFAPALSEEAASTYFDVAELESGYYQVTIKDAFFDKVTWVTCDGIALSFDNTIDGQDIEVSLEPFSTTIIEEYTWTNTKHAFVTLENVDGEVKINVNSNVEFVNSIDECIDKNKLYVIDGFIYNYQTKTITHNPINLIPKSIKSDGTQYIGDNGEKGYRPGYRINSSDVEIAISSYACTGHIPCTVNDVIYSKNMNFETSSNSQVRVYDANFNLLAVLSGSNAYNALPSLLNEKGDLEGSIANATTSLTDEQKASIAYIRIVALNFNETAMITINESPEGGTIVSENWYNTGHAFVPADYEDRIIEIEHDVSSLERRVDELIVNNNDTTFTYITEEAKRVADVVKSKQTAGSLTFTSMSDFHVEYNTTNEFGLKNNETSLRDAGLGLVELQKYLRLDLITTLGDYSWAGKDEIVSQVKSDIELVKYYLTKGMMDVPNIWCTGNHDINYGINNDRRMTKDELFAYLINNNKGTIQDSDNIDRNYGYIDFENQRIRCIYLNTIDSLDYPENTDGTAEDDASEITAIQTQWLADVGLNLSDKADAEKWGIVIFSHHCISIFKHITSILTAYKEGKSGTINVTTNGITSAVNYNFTSIPRGEIICAIHGHNHNFSYKKISDENWHAITEGKAWLWSICIPNMDTTRNNEAATATDTNWAKAFGDFDSNGNPVYYPKTQGTAKSTSFCVITIDRKNRKIHAIAYGAGIDREINY